MKVKNKTGIDLGNWLNDHDAHFTDQEAVCKWAEDYSAYDFDGLMLTCENELYFVNPDGSPLSVQQ